MFSPIPENTFDGEFIPRNLDFINNTAEELGNLSFTTLFSAYTFSTGLI